MDSKHAPHPGGNTDGRANSSQPDARGLLLDKGADQLEPRPWQHYPGGSPTSADLTQYALWRSSELTQDELLGALSLLPTARAEAESVEIGLLFAARADGLAWAQIAEAMGFRSPQACQQYVSRLSAKQDSRP
jgi:hypothetical protein